MHPAQQRNMTTLAPAKRTQLIQDCVSSDIIQHSQDIDGVDLCSGCPDFRPPDFVLEALQEAISQDGLHQYTRDLGHVRLVNILARMYSLLSKREIDPSKEVLVTVGAHGALHDTFQGLVNPGDEVIIIEPFSNRYESMVRMADGVPVFVPLRPKKEGERTRSDWILDKQELASKFNPMTRMIIVNTPHCPTGKVFSWDELDTIARLCKKHNVICVADEAWEWVVFEGAKHVRMNTLPGMWERTVTIGSAGTTFGVTGWKIGWAYGPQPLLRGLLLVHQNCVALVSTVLQEAVAVAMEKIAKQMADPSGHLSALSVSMQKKRDFICRALNSAGITPTVPEAGHFLVSDFSEIGSKVHLEGTETKDCMLASWLFRTKNLLVSPMGSFYSADHRHLAGYLMRISFAKSDSTLEKAAAVLSELRAVC